MGIWGKELDLVSSGTRYYAGLIDTSIPYYINLTRVSATRINASVSSNNTSSSVFNTTVEEGYMVTTKTGNEFNQVVNNLNTYSITRSGQNSVALSSQEATVGGGGTGQSTFNRMVSGLYRCWWIGGGDIDIAAQRTNIQNLLTDLGVSLP